MPNGTIDQLNFEVILNDAAFNQKVAADIRLAEDLNTKMSAALNIAATQTALNIDSSRAMGDINTFTATLNQLFAQITKQTSLNVTTGQSKQELDAMKQQLDNILQQIQNINKQKVNPSVNNNNLNQQNKGLKEQSALLGQLTTLAKRYFSVIGATRFLSSLVDITGEFEVQRMALRTILNDAEKAEVVFEKLRQFAVESPYTFQELSKYTKQLAAFDIPTDKLLETNKMLADVAAGLGVSMDRLILAYGHVKSSGFLRGMQLRQFTQNGVPILEQLSDILTEVEGKTVSVGEVFEKMTKRQIDFAMVEEAFKRMTSEGGKFYQMQEVLVDTLKGKIGKLKDTFQQAMYDMGQSGSTVLKGTVDFATMVVKNLENILKVLSPLIAGYGAYTAALLANLVAQKAIAAYNFGRKLVIVLKNLDQLTRVMKLINLSAASMIGVFAALATAIGALVIHLSKQNSYLEVATDSSRKYAAQIAIEKNELKSLLAQMESAESGTKKYDNARDSILSKYGEYLSDIDKENIALGKTAGLYDKISASLQDVAKQKFMQEGMEELSSKYQKQYKAWLHQAEQYLTEGSAFAQRWGEDIRREVERYIYGDIDYNALSAAARNALTTISKETQGQLNITTDIREKYLAIVHAFEQGKERLSHLFESSSNNDEYLGPFLNDVPKWKQTLNKALAEIDKDFWNKLGIKSNEGWYEYQKRISEEYKELMEQIKNAPDKDYAKEFQSELDALKKLDKAFKGQLLTEKATKNEETEADRVKRKKIETLTAEINVLNKLRDAYEKLQVFTDAGTAKALMHSIFDESLWERIDSNAFSTDNVIKLIDELNGLSPEKAETLMASLGKDGLDEIISKWRKLQTTTKGYFDAIQSWTAEDTDIQGKGFFYDISKVASDLETNLNKITLKANKAKAQLSQLVGSNADQKSALIRGLMNDGYSEKDAENFWNQWVRNGSSAIDELVAESEQKVKAAAKERVNDLARSYVEDRYFMDGIDLSHLSDKTRGQLKTLKEKLMSFMTDLNGPDESAINVLKLAGIDINNLKDTNLDMLDDSILGRMLDDYGIDKATISILKLMKAVQMASGSWDEFTGSVKKALKEGIKNIDEEDKKNVMAFGKAFIDNVTSMASAYKEFAQVTKNDTLGDVIEGFEVLGDIAGSVIERLSKGDVLGAIVSGVKVLWDKVAEAITASARLKAAIADVAQEADHLNFTARLNEGTNSIFGSDTLRNVRNAAIELRKLSNSVYSNAGSRNITWKSGLFNWGRSSNDLASIVKELGYELYDQYGNLNADALQKVLDTYESLTYADREWIEDAIDASRRYTEAMKVVEDAAKGIFGQIADNAADAIVEGWIEAGNAALDYTDILDDVAKAYAKMVIKSAIMERFFDENKAKEVADYFMSGQDDKAMEAITEAMKGINESAPVWEKILETFDPYFKKETSGGNSNLGEAIKNSITEEQTGLLASYINAMRADLSFMRGRQTSYFDYMQVTMPTLAEHVASIEAHTFDIMQSSAMIAESNASILTELRSVIGTGSSGLPTLRAEAA